jgi:hypothetical protein
MRNPAAPGLPSRGRQRFHLSFQGTLALPCKTSPYKKEQIDPYQESTCFLFFFLLNSSL